MHEEYLQLLKDLRNSKARQDEATNKIKNNTDKSSYQKYSVAQGYLL